MSTLLHDLRIAVRWLAKSWGFTLVALTALAIGICANVTVFGFVNALLLRPLDVPEPDRLVRADSGGADFMRLLYHSDYEAYRDRNQSFESLAMFHGGWVSPVTIDGNRQMIAVTPVSGNYFETLGVRAALGRAIEPEDEAPGAEAVVVLSTEGSRRYFGGDPDVIGRTIHIHTDPFVVVGVLPRSFKGTVYPSLPQIYTTFAPTRRIREDPPGYFIGRLEPGVSREEAEADLARIASQLSRERGESKTIALYRGSAAHPKLLEIGASLGTLFMVVVGAVLWIACSNIAILLLARAAGRRREIGVRLALGAGRARIVRQLLVESLVLASVGGLGAAFLAHATSRWLSRIYFPVPMPIALVYELDWRVVVFTVAVSFGATLLFGLAPALHALKTDVVSSIKQGDHGASIGRSRTSFSLVVTQVAASTAVLALGALMIRSATTPPDRGFDTGGVLMATVRTLDKTPVERGRFINTVLARFEETPGVVAASAVDSIPLTNNAGPLVPVDLSPQPPDLADSSPGAPRPLVYSSRIAGDFFGALGIPLLQGRGFHPRDALSAPAVGVVNETLAARFWPGESPVGRLLYEANGDPIEIVGLARDSKYVTADEEPLAFVYRPLAQDPTMTPTFLVRTNLPVDRASASAREQIAAVDPDLVPYNLQTLEKRLEPGVQITIAWVSSGLGLLGVLLGAVGTYGLVAWSTYERRRELAVRIALGASHASLVRRTALHGTYWAATGVAIGLVLFLVGAQYMRSLMRGVAPFELLPVAGVAALLLAVAYAASWFPARRVSRTDPLAWLREG